MPENKLHFWALFIYLYMNNKDNKLIVDVYKEAIKKNLDKKKSAIPKYFTDELPVPTND